MTNPIVPLPVAEALNDATYGDPFQVLGLHERYGRWTITVCRPGVERVDAVTVNCSQLAALERIEGTDVFAAALPADPGSAGYRLQMHAQDETWIEHDPYRFAPVIGALDEHLIGEGSHLELWKVLGAHLMQHEGVDGVHFAVWAPNAQRVAVVGDFNHWDHRRHPMRRRGTTGVWELFLPAVTETARYKFEVLQASGVRIEKSDPFGFGAEHPPQTASVIRQLDRFGWKDADWIASRKERHQIDPPISLYEAPLGSWQKADGGARSLTYQELAARLVPYVRDLGFTHLELLPITEHPFDGSWGYQPIGLYAPTCRYGSADEFRDFVEACHAAKIGLILDWVPGHFPNDAHGLAQFDGTPLYEHADPREGFHKDWNTLIFNYGRREVQNYLVANALYWIKEHHIDGLRVDAVASMLYRDYSREPGEWIPNEHGGRENLEAIAFLKRMNEVVYGGDDSVMTVAEESTAWPGVSQPTSSGGLGFGYKWNMGWMNDTLDYMSRDPIHRRHHHHQMTFGLHYAFSENFVLPLSHDEVVHGKGSILDRMPGAGFDRFANMRAYLGFMWGHPGKKLLFMGQEFAQGAEWNHDKSLDWHLTEIGFHSGMQALVRDLNRVYRSVPALHQLDCKAEGFDWIDGGNADESVFAWARYGSGDTPPAIVVCNFTPVERGSFRLGVPAPGFWAECINTDAEAYAGGGRGNLGGVQSTPTSWHGRENSIEITLPPLTTLMFELQR